MREIKFRAWTGSVMEYKVMAGYLGPFYVPGIDPTDSASMSPMNTIYDSCPIMQFTGLKDKNGTEIYEGDILRGKWINNNHKETWVVKYIIEKGAFCYKAKNGITNPLIYAFTMARELEVTGNIYENHELVTNLNEK